MTVVSGVSQARQLPNGDPVDTASAGSTLPRFRRRPSSSATRPLFLNLRAPGYVNTDLAIQKWFTFKEDFRLQFRAEMFNVATTQIHPIPT